MASRPQPRPVPNDMEEESRQRFARELVGRILTELRLGRDDLLGEVCCPASSLAAELARRAQLDSDAVAVDCAPATANDRVDLGVRWVDLDPLSFSSFPIYFDKVLVSDALSLVPDRPGFVANVRERLRTEASRLLIVQRAPDPDLPLFKEARRRWEASYVPPDDLLKLLGRAGLRARHASIVHRHWLQAEHVPQMVKARGLPILYTFSVQELAAGAEESREHCEGRAWAVFTERLDLFTAEPTKGRS